MQRLAASILLLALAACGGAPPKPADTPTASGGAAPQTAKTATRQADSKPLAAPTTPVESAALPAEPKEPEIPVSDDPAQFMAATGGTLREALGDPVLVRRDGPAEVWQFHGDACKLDLFLYPGDTGGLTVKFVDLRGEGEEESRACLARMLRAHIIAADG